MNFQSRDVIRISFGFWSTDFLTENYDQVTSKCSNMHFWSSSNFEQISRAKSVYSKSSWSRVIEPFRICTFGPLYLFEPDQNCIFEQFAVTWSPIRRQSQWTITRTACIFHHVKNAFKRFTKTYFRTFFRLVPVLDLLKQ